MTFPEYITSIARKKRFSRGDGTDTWKYGGDLKAFVWDETWYTPVAQVNDTFMCVITGEDLERSNVYSKEPEHAPLFFALSLSEIFHRKELIKLRENIGKQNDLDVSEQLERFRDCYGCQYWLASAMITTPLDEGLHNPERNTIAASVLEKIADAGDPRACSELSRYYHFADDAEASLQWKIKAGELGSWPDMKEAADTIIDSFPDKVELALTMMQRLRKHNQYVAWCDWREANIYLRGTLKPLDPAKGLELLTKSSDAGWGLAMADLSYFLFHGKGIAQDKPGAIALLKKANRLTNYRFAETLKRLQEEMEFGL